MKRTLSDRLLQSLARSRTTSQEIWDQQLRGFGVRASKLGTVSFFAMRRPRGSSKSVRIKIGDFPTMPLSDARQRARALLMEMQDGIDPRIRKAEEMRIAAADKANTFAAVAERYISRHLKTKRAAREIERLIRRELLPRWGARPIASITRTELIALVDEIVDRGCPEMARLVFTYARRLFGWAISHGNLEHSPADHVPVKDLCGARKVRQRVLDDCEVQLLWRATEGPEASYYGPFARLALLLGTRRSELGRSPWREINFAAGLWTIPPGRMKMELAHVVPLPPAAVEILRSLPQGNGYVIGGAPIHFARAKAQLDIRMTALNGGKPIPPWRWHDLRRTFRTGLSRVGIAPHIAELAVGHTPQGMRKVYDRYQFLGEKRHAFNAWAAHVVRIVGPPEGVVVPLRTGT